MSPQMAEAPQPDAEQKDSDQNNSGSSAGSSLLVGAAIAAAITPSTGLADNTNDLAMNELHRGDGIVELAQQSQGSSGFEFAPDGSLIITQDGDRHDNSNLIHADQPMSELELRVESILLKAQEDKLKATVRFVAGELDIYALQEGYSKADRKATNGIQDAFYKNERQMQRAEREAERASMQAGDELIQVEFRGKAYTVLAPEIIPILGCKEGTAQLSEHNLAVVRANLTKDQRHELAGLLRDLRQSQASFNSSRNRVLRHSIYPDELTSKRGPIAKINGTFEENWNQKASQANRLLVYALGDDPTTSTSSINLVTEDALHQLDRQTQDLLERIQSGQIRCISTSDLPKPDSFTPERRSEGLDALNRMTQLRSSYYASEVRKEIADLSARSHYTGEVLEQALKENQHLYEVERANFDLKGSIIGVDLSYAQGEITPEYRDEVKRQFSEHLVPE